MEISHVFMFEKLRDGGSLVVSFQSKDSCEYWIMFPIVSFDVGNPEYQHPILINRTTGIEVHLSYSGAKQWLRKIEPYFIERPELPHIAKQSEEAIFNKMKSICEVNT
jgi:hypothetical protein